MSEIVQLSVDRLDTPIGQLLVVTDQAGSLRAVDWTDYESRMHRLLRLHYGEAGFNMAAATHSRTDALRAYFAGDLKAVESIAVQTGGTPFQNSVWQALRGIPAASTLSYVEVARQISRPKAVRAVGLANGANPVGIVIPCHRVIGSNGSLTGYGGGLHRKLWLLDHERAHASQ